jgi:methylmalonyl-CoA epimerase
MIKGLYSITIAVEDLDQAVANYKELLGAHPTFGSGYEAMLAGTGLRELGIDFHDEAAIFDLPGCRFILLTASRKDSPVGKFLAKRGEGVFMVSLETDNLSRETARLKGQGQDFVLKENAAGNFGETNYLHPRSMNHVLIEIFEPGGFFAV